MALVTIMTLMSLEAMAIVGGGSRRRISVDSEISGIFGNEDRECEPHFQAGKIHETQLCVFEWQNQGHLEVIASSLLFVFRYERLAHNRGPQRR